MCSSRSLNQNPVRYLRADTQTVFRLAGAVRRPPSKTRAPRVACSIFVFHLHYWRQVESCKLMWSTSKSGAKARQTKGPTSTENNTVRILLFRDISLFWFCPYCTAAADMRRRSRIHSLRFNLRDLWNRASNVGNAASWVNSLCTTDILFLLDLLNKPFEWIRVSDLRRVLSSANPLGHL